MFKNTVGRNIGSLEGNYLIAKSQFEQNPSMRKITIGKIPDYRSRNYSITSSLYKRIPFIRKIGLNPEL